MRASVPQVSVIVPVWNRPADIDRCLASLADQTLPRDAYEVIVVDNGSTDATPDVARAHADVTVLVEPKPGSYAARNRGIAAARGEYIAFIDSDCRADRDWLCAALEAARAHPEAGIISGRVELEAMGGDARPGLCDAYERQFAFNQKKLATQGRAVTANWLSPATLLRALGGFRDDLKSGGDVHLAKRIVAAGHPIHFAPAMLVFHPARATLGDLTAKARRVIGGQMTSQGRLRNPAHWIARSARVSAYRTREVWRAKDQPAAAKLGLTGLLAILFVVSAGEAVRISAGGTPRRQ